MIMSNPATLPPGFRFHPTDEELILHYLRNRAASAPCPVAIIADVDIYKFDPWDLPCKAMYGDREWYFFSPRDRKYPNGVRPNRAAASGYWKATGTDKPIHSSRSNESIGVKKALVFYKGRPPKGIKTNWIMHEYRLAGADAQSCSRTYKPMKFRNTSMRLDDWVLCRIYKKSGHLLPVAPPLAGEQEHDEPCGYEESGYALPSMAAAMQHAAAGAALPQQLPGAAAAPVGQGRLPRIPSLSEFLDEYALAQLFDGASVPDMPPPRPAQGDSLAVPQVAYMDASTSAAAAAPKRKGGHDHYSDEEAGNAKKLNGASFYAGSFSGQGVNANASASANGMQSALGMSHHMLLNSNLGLH